MKETDYNLVTIVTKFQDWYLKLSLLTHDLQGCTLNRLNYNSLTTRGPFLEGPEKFAHPESRSKIPNLIITEMVYTHVFNMNLGSLYHGFRRIHLSGP